MQVWAIQETKYKKRSPAEIITHMGTNDLSHDKKPKDVASDIIQLDKLVKTNANKVAVSSIIPRKDKLCNKAKEVNTHVHMFYK